MSKLKYPPLPICCTTAVAHFAISRNLLAVVFSHPGAVYRDKGKETERTKNGKREGEEEKKERERERKKEREKYGENDTYVSEFPNKPGISGVYRVAHEYFIGAG